MTTIEAADALAEVCRDALFGPTRDVERRVREAGFDDARDWVSHAIDLYDAARGAPVVTGPQAPGLPPTDADVEHLRRAMVEAWQTVHALSSAVAQLDSTPELHDGIDVARREFGAAARAYVAAKRARGGQ